MKMFRRNLVLGLVLFMAVFVVVPAKAALNDLLVAHYSFDNSADLYDANPDIYDMTNKISTPTATTGQIGGAVNFAGNQGYYFTMDSDTDNAIYPTGTFAAATWVKANAVPTLAQTWVSRSRYWRCGFEISTYQDGDTFKWAVGANSYTTTYSHTIILGETIDVGEWTHLAFSFTPSGSPVDGIYTGTGNFYINGKLFATQSDMSYEQARHDNTDRFAIGCLGSGSSTTYNQFNGSVDDFGIWDGSVSALDIAVVHAMGLLESLNLESSEISQFKNIFNAQGLVEINGHNWAYKTGLTGVLGTVGGSIAGGDAFVILDNAGNGMMIPEPVTIAILGIGGLVMFRKRS